MANTLNLPSVLETVWSSMPTLDIGNRVGNSDYIDFIKKSELIHPAMAGVDKFKRPFFVLSAIIDNEDPSHEHIELSQVFFQRYTDDLSTWASAQIEWNSSRQIMETSGGISIDQMNFLSTLIKNKFIDVTPELIKQCRLSGLLTNNISMIYLHTDKSSIVEHLS